MIILFAGSIGRFPVGGHAWVDMHYLLGLKALGHEVVYFEECGPESWVYNWETEEFTTDLEYPTQYLYDCLASIGFDYQWIYRAGTQSSGMSLDRFLDLCARADLLIVRGSPISLWLEEYEWPNKCIYIDSDPGFTQIRLANGDPDLVETVKRSSSLFTVGQCVGSPDCSVPTVGYDWLPILPPIYLPSWPVINIDDTAFFTTLMQWRSYPEVTFAGIQYGNKDVEFPKFIDLPKQTTQPFQIALTGPHSAPEPLLENRWNVATGWEITYTPEAYQQFIQNSRAEFAVAKQGYVAMKTGWFSDRSASYLASGRPILVQDTGIGNRLPLGEGLLTFENPKEAIAGVKKINLNYGTHSAAARHLAEEYFSAHRILNFVLEVAMN
ncbi:MAG: glycosyltransferase family 1 protein [Moorea sp. SIO4E2]|uniref:glycosyltransferase family 1 protein n=1 Tax=Moorena sp. SIO4E2 TaxID=2607826 RepID=UPI0013B81140|nr:glycosyltransferase family 1 protein [Moorena sp. SIO4E2]NEQ05168.1 glycosyltransferase family 1 protein [Moorena sp. SIO4E2]